jgi:putative transposase
MRDRDDIYGTAFRDRLAGMVIEEVVSAPPLAVAEPIRRASDRFIRRECLDYIIVLGERHLRRNLAAYFAYCHRSRTHLSLNKDAPASRPASPPAAGNVVELPEVGGLHHRYEHRAA